MIFLSILSSGIIFAANGFAAQKAVLPGLVQGERLSERERSDGSVDSVGHLVEAAKEIYRAEDTQSTQYSDANVVPLDAFPRPEVGDGAMPEVAADAQHDVSDVHSEHGQGCRVSSVHSGVGHAGIPGTSEDGPARADDAASHAQHEGRGLHSQMRGTYLQLTPEQLAEMRARVTLVAGDQPSDVDPRKQSEE